LNEKCLLELCTLGTERERERERERGDRIGVC